MPDSKYRYFIHYSVSSALSGTLLGFGNNEFTSDRPIETIEDINAIEEHYASIINQNMLERRAPGGPVAVVISNWKLLGPAIRKSE